MTSPCSLVDRQMQLLLDGRITPEGRAALDKHTAVCPACTAQLDEYRAINRLAAGWARPSAADDPGGGFNAAVLRRLVVDLPVSQPVAEPHYWFRLAAAALLIAACAVLMRFVGPSSNLALLPSGLSAPLAPQLWAGALRAFGGLGALLARPASLLSLSTLGSIACAAAAVNAFFIWRVACGHRRQVAPR